MQLIKEYPIKSRCMVVEACCNIVQSIDFVGKKCYNYENEEGRIVRATEADVEFAGELVTSKVVVNTVMKKQFENKVNYYYYYC